MAWTKLCAALLVLRTGAYQAGERPVLGTNAPPPTSRKPQAFSVAQRTEQQSRLGVTIKYLAPLAERLGISFAERQRRKTSSEDDAYWEHKDGKWEFGEWVDGEWKADKSAGDMPPWLKAEMNPDGSLKKMGTFGVASAAVLLATLFALARTRSRDFLRERRSRATFGHSA